MGEDLVEDKEVNAVIFLRDESEEPIVKQRTRGTRYDECVKVQGKECLMGSYTGTASW